MAIDKVLIVEPTPYSGEVSAILSERADVTLGDYEREELLQVIGGFSAVFVRLGQMFDSEMIARASSLRVIATPTTGLNHIDIVAAKAANVDVLCLRDEVELLESLSPTAELTWGLLLSVVRRIPKASLHTQSGGWDRNLFWSTELYGKTLGIIGFGRLGRKVANYGLAFGMNVIAFDVRASRTSGLPITLVDKETLIESADVVSIHASFSQGNLPVLNEQNIEGLKPGCIVINTARGELVDESALIRAIKSGRIAGAGLDVICSEQNINKDLVTLQSKYNLIITPHIGGATIESIRKTELYMAHKLRDYLDKLRNGE
jgi:D-3-phosphoglycerate dehydrogenase